MSIQDAANEVQIEWPEATEWEPGFKAWMWRDEYMVIQSQIVPGTFRARDPGKSFLPAGNHFFPTREAAAAYLVSIGRGPGAPKPKTDAEILAEMEARGEIPRAEERYGYWASRFFDDGSVTGKSGGQWKSGRGGDYCGGLEVHESELAAIRHLRSLGFGKMTPKVEEPESRLLWSEHYTAIGSDGIQSWRITRDDDAEHWLTSPGQKPRKIGTLKEAMRIANEEAKQAECDGRSVPFSGSGQSGPIATGAA